MSDFPPPPQQPPQYSPPVQQAQPPEPFSWPEPAPQQVLVSPPGSSKPSRKLLALILSLAIGIPLLGGLAVVAVIVIVGLTAEPKPPALSLTQSDRMESEVDERLDLLDQLDTNRADYQTQVSQWDQSLSWTEDNHASSLAPTPNTPNPGGDAMPGGDPYGRAFLDSIGAGDVTVVFEAGPENCGYYGTGGGAGYVYAGGCFNGTYANTLFMAWDSGAEDIVWSIFVHEAMHWYQNEHYLQDTYLADFAGIDYASYNERWEADASCRAVYTYGISIDEYVGSSSPCTIDGWYEGFIADYLGGLGARITEPDPATFEVAEASRP